MNKKQLVELIAQELNSTNAAAERSLDAVFDVIEKAMRQNEPVPISGFGKFSIVHRPARTGRNPQTGEPLEIPKRNVPCFRPYSALKKAVNP